MPRIIPLTAEPARRFETDLNGLRVFFSMKYNPNENQWSFDFEDSDGIIFYGFPMLGGVDLFGPRKDLNDIYGKLFLVDRSGRKLDPDGETLGNEVVMLHFDPDEVVDINLIISGKI